MFGLQAPELLIILLILIVLFGASRLRGLGGALGGSIREFRRSVRDEDAPQQLEASAHEPHQLNAPQRMGGTEQPPMTPQPPAGTQQSDQRQ